MKITSSKTMKEVSLKQNKKNIIYKMYIILLNRRYLTLTHFNRG